MKRTKHGLSHYVLSTFDMGQLVPVSNFEVLPGDSVRMSTSALIRVSPLMTPVMHPVTVRLHHWFVPYRLIMDDWEPFITGGSDGEGDGSSLPQIVVGAGNKAEHTLGNYLGIPANAPDGANVSAFPFRAYNKIYNEFYRDQDLLAEVGEDSLAVQRCAWEKDRFTSARPWTQKGPEVTIPLDGLVLPGAEHSTGAQAAMLMRRAVDGAFPTTNGVLSTNVAGEAQSSATTLAAPAFATVYPSNLRVEAAEASVNDFRLAFALQRYQEARAAYGSRYTEYLRYLGVRSSDARLQRPEYLGGGRTTISFSEVLKTGEGDTPDDEAPIGEMRGHGIAAIRSRRFIRFFEEHGVVLTLASLRPRSLYVQGLHRMWRRATKEDFWQRELEQIGQQEVFNYEVYAAHSSFGGVFGYNDRYSEYRHLPSYVTGEFQSVLADWHMGRIFAADVSLNDEFIDCVPTKRIHAEQTNNSIWAMFSHSIQARRMVSNRVIGRLF